MVTAVSHEYEYEQIVYLRTDMDQLPRMVVEISFTSNLAPVTYGVKCGTEYSVHTEGELSPERLTLWDGDQEDED